MLRSVDVAAVERRRAWTAARRVRACSLEGWLLGGAAIGLACGVLLAVGWLRIVAGTATSSSLAAAFSLTAFLSPRRSARS